MTSAISRTNFLHSVVLFGLWSSHSWATGTKTRGGCSCSSTKTSAVLLVECSCATVNKSEAVSDPTWVTVNVTIATRHGCADFCVWDNVM